ncbi:MAG TPA: c-type cytochrome [Kofleriaceae bacterium]|nr:c-type cytochrome [Kofleriaceae bacterium]
MLRPVLAGAVLAGALAALFSVVLPRPAATAAPGKNLKVYPKDTDLKVIKKDMKVVSKALGVQCDFCHDLDAFEKDNEHKEEARKMMKMVSTINTKLKKDGFKAEVSCMTCHAGKKHPPKK